MRKLRISARAMPDAPPTADREALLLRTAEEVLLPLRKNKKAIKNIA